MSKISGPVKLLIKKLLPKGCKVRAYYMSEAKVEMPLPLEQTYIVFDVGGKIVARTIQDIQDLINE